MVEAARSGRLRVAAGVAALALGAAGHFHGHMGYLDRLNTSSIDVPDRADLPLPPIKPAERLVVVVVDGLRHDAAGRLPGLRALAAEGVWRPLIADFPSFTHANITTMATGVPPVLSGVRLNADDAFSTLDSVSKAAARAGIPVGVAGGGFEAFEDLLSLPDAETPSARIDDAVGQGAILAWLKAMPEGGGLVWVYFGAVDEEGHRHGAASEEYAEAAEEADALVAAIGAQLDPARDALVVLSDHGHLDAGGHGGVEPEVLRATFLAWGGPFLRGAAPGPAPMRAVAPTLAAVLGCEIPRKAVGEVMTDAVGQIDAVGDTVGQIDAVEMPSARIDDAVGQIDAVETPSLGSRGGAGEGVVVENANVINAMGGVGGVGVAEASSGGAAVAALPGLEVSFDRGRAAARVGWASAAVLLVLVSLGWASWRRRLDVRWRDLGPAALYGALFSIGYVALGYRWTWSIPQGELVFTIETGLIGVVAAALALLSGRRERRGQEALGVAALYGAPYVLLSAFVGLDPGELAAPDASYAMVLLATAIFYVGVAFGLSALRPARKTATLRGVGVTGAQGQALDDPSGKTIEETTGDDAQQPPPILAFDVDDGEPLPGRGLGVDRGPAP